MLTDKGEKLHTIEGEHNPPIAKYLSLIREGASLEVAYNALVDLYNEGFKHGADKR